MGTKKVVSDFFVTCFQTFRFRLFILLTDHFQIFQNQFEAPSKSSESELYSDTSGILRKTLVLGKE